MTRYLTKIFAYLKYAMWLIKEIFMSASDVSKSIWLNKEITPDFAYIKPDLPSDLHKVIYANSITLTPGTITVALDNDIFLVHALHSENLEDLDDGVMQQKVQRL